MLDTFVRKVRVRSYGDEHNAGVSVVMFAGLGAGLEFLDPLAQIVGQEYRAVIVDTPGFGLTPRAKGPYRYKEVCALLEEVVFESCVGKPVVLVGQSSGALIGFEVAGVARGDLTIIGMLMIGGTGLSFAELVKRPFSWSSLRSGRFRLIAHTLMMAAIRTPNRLRDLALRSTLVRRLTLSPFLAEPAMADSGELACVLTNSGSLTALRIPRAMRSVDFEKAARSVTAPVRSIAGDGDPYFLVGDAARLCSIVDLVEDRRIAGARHWLTVEHLDEVARWLCDGVEKCSRDRK